MFHFVANLKRYTLLEVAPVDRFGAYLLSADYASGLTELAGMVKAEQRVLVADNGNMDVFEASAESSRPMLPTSMLPVGRGRKPKVATHDPWIYQQT